MRPIYLLIADAFHPKSIPPEASTNTFLASALAERGWTVAVWAGTSSTLPPDVRDMRLIRTVDYWGLAEVLRIVLWIVANRPACIGLAYFSEMYSGRAYITLVPLAARLCGIPCTTLFTNGQRPKGVRLGRLVSWLRRRGGIPAPLGLLEHSAKLIFYSNLDRDAIMKSSRPGLQARTALCNPPSILPGTGSFDSSACRTDLRATAGDFLIGYFGMFYPGKSVEILLDAVQLLRSRGIVVKVALIGADKVAAISPRRIQAHMRYRDDLRERIGGAGMEDQVTWTGYVAPLQGARFISSCDVICLPFKAGLTSTRSSFIECARLGVPVITTRSGATDPFLCRDDSGITFVSPQNPAELAEAILELRNDPEERARRGGLIRQFAETYCGSGALIDAFDWRGTQHKDQRS